MRRNSFKVAIPERFIRLIRFEAAIACGIIAGVLYAAAADWPMTFSVRSFWQAEQSMTLHYIYYAIPLLLTVIAVFCNCRGAVHFLATLKFFLFSFAAASLWIAFPDSGWLICLLFMACDWLILSAYHWLWLRCCVSQSLRRYSDILICGCVLVISVLFDLFVINPFRVSLYTFK